MGDGRWRAETRSRDGVVSLGASLVGPSFCFFFFSSRRRHTRLQGDWSSDVCSSDLTQFLSIYGCIPLGPLCSMSCPGNTLGHPADPQQKGDLWDTRRLNPSFSGLPDYKYVFFRRQATSQLPRPRYCIRCKCCAPQWAPIRMPLSRQGWDGSTCTPCRIAALQDRSWFSMDKLREDTLDPLAGQVAVITGAGRGIGAAIAQELSKLGATAVLCGRTRAALEGAARAIAQAGGQAEVLLCDVTSLQSVEAAARQVESSFGRADILVNNAGIGGFGGPLHQLPPESWDQILNTNLRGVYYAVRAFAPLMIRARSGHIINISSLAGKNALPNGAAYAASKWGLNGLSYSMAEELRGHNIRVAVICPGSTNTDLSPHAGKDPAKMLQPEDVAHAVAMLVTQSPQSFVSEILLRPTQKP